MNKQAFFFFFFLTQITTDSVLVNCSKISPVPALFTSATESRDHTVRHRAGEGADTGKDLCGNKKNCDSIPILKREFVRKHHGVLLL